MAKTILEQIEGLKDHFVSNVLNFFQGGRSAYIFLCGVLQLVLFAVLVMATFDSRDAVSAPAGWNRFVAATGSNQWLSATVLLSSACIVLSINYLPRLEGEI